MRVLLISLALIVSPAATTPTPQTDQPRCVCVPKSPYQTCTLRDGTFGHMVVCSCTNGLKYEACQEGA